jgi:hypothetical protein
MDRSQYLHVHLPGRGRLTLSVPTGVERALLSGKLTADAEVWYDQLQLWVKISRHPEMARLLQLLETQTSPVSGPGLQAPFDLDSPAKVASQSGVESHDPAQLPLIAVADADEQREFAEFLKRSSEAEVRRRTVRSSGSGQPTQPARVLVAGALEPVRKAGERLRHWVPAALVPSWAASIALTVLGALALGLFFAARSSDLGREAAPVMVTNALSAYGEGIDSIIGTVPAEPSPLAAEERELEANLRIAEAVVWQPALDFSPEVIWRSARKVDAVRNSISLYRIAAWRHIDSLTSDTDPLLEPFEEAVRVDEVLNTVHEAVSLLNSLNSAFHVHGEVLVFADQGQADRYVVLRNRADSLLRTPISEDTTHLLRAPRRVVTRLVETLPPAVVRTP